MRRIATRLGACLVLGVVLASGARADEPEEYPDTVTVKGQTLRGRIVRIRSETLELDTIYGEGSVHIPLEDIEHVESGEPFRVYFGSDDETVGGRLLDVREGMLVVGDDPADAVTVDLDEVHFGVSQPEYERSFWNRLRSDFREWGAELELGMNFEEGAIEKRKLRFGGRIDRRREPFRLRVEAAYAFDREQRRADPAQTTKNEFSGTLLGQYTLWKKLFGFGLMGGEFDYPRGVAARLYPTAGVGWRWFDTERATLSPQIGFGWVLEDFETVESNNYAAIHFGLEGRYEFWKGSVLRGTAGYWPDITSPGENWLFRTELSLTVPVWDPLSLRGTIININDNNPTPDTGNNKFETLLGIVLNF